MSVRVLVIEDEAKVAQALREGLEHEHYEVTIAGTGEDGLGSCSWNTAPHFGHRMGSRLRS